LVDIHSHILPGIDDGAATIEQSLDMLRLAAAKGTTDIVATPHANSEFQFDPQLVGELFTELSQQSADFITIHRGCDFHLNFDNLMDCLDHPKKYTINEGRYLMVELPDLVSLPSMRTALNRLLDARIVPIITHPERNPSVQAKLKEMEGWVHDGCLLQVTAQSYSGRFGNTAQKSAESLTNANMVHFVASDAHDTEDRPPDLSSAYRFIAERWGGDMANMLLLDNPAAVIHNQPIFFVPPKPSKKSSLFSFWK
jgi:protein-tyrosine phosphatase